MEKRQAAELLRLLKEANQLKALEILTGTKDRLLTNDQADSLREIIAG